MPPTETTYRAVFSGELRRDADPTEVRRRLAVLYKKPPAEIERLFSGRRLVLKRGLDADRAEQMQTAFHRAGAVLELEPEVAVADDASTSERERAGQRVCPSCGFEQPVTETSCLRCGIVFLKYEAKLEAAKRRAEENARRKEQVEAHRQADEAARQKAREAVQRQAAKPRLATSRPAAPSAATADASAVGAPGAPAAEGPAERSRQDGPPTLQVDTFDYSGFVGTLVICALLNLIIIGLWKSPQMLWSFLGRHIRINDRQLSFHDPWLLIRSNLSIVVGLLLYIVAMIPVMLLTSILPADLATFLRYLAVVLLLPVILGVPHLVMLQSLWRNTHWNGQSIGRPYPLRSIAGIRSTVETHWQELYVGGLAELAILCVVPSALGALILLRQWTNRFEVNGYRLEVPLPAGFAVKYTILGAVTLGLGSVWAVRAFFNQLLPAGRWVQAPASPSS
jgi:hypothetical protein